MKREGNGDRRPRKHPLTRVRPRLRGRTFRTQTGPHHHHQLLQPKDRHRHHRGNGNGRAPGEVPAPTRMAERNRVLHAYKITQLSNPRRAGRLHRKSTARGPGERHHVHSTKNGRVAKAVGRSHPTGRGHGAAMNRPEIPAKSGRRPERKRPAGTRLQRRKLHGSGSRIGVRRKTPGVAGSSAGQNRGRKGSGIGTDSQNTVPGHRRTGPQANNHGRHQANGDSDTPTQTNDRGLRREGTAASENQQRERL